MTDKELLELAAKAACYKDIEHDASGLYRVIGEHEDGTLCMVQFNPLTDDGDALRLAVKLGFVVDTNNKRVIEAERLAFGHKDWVYADDEDLSGDEATRRAIVRAAAAIGSKI